MEPPLYVLQLGHFKRRPRVVWAPYFLHVALSLALWGLIIWGTCWLVMR